MQVHKSIILASASPRRRQLLTDCGLKFDVFPANTEENFPPQLSIEEIPVFIAKEKALALKNQLAEKEVIIAADTIVVLENKILGKPANSQEAIEILKQLSGKEHEVITGVAIHTLSWQEEFFEKTIVKFSKLSDTQIRYYVENYHPFDKAGAYAIQEWIGMTGISSIQGDYYNVIGLPVFRLMKILEENGVITI